MRFLLDTQLLIWVSLRPGWLSAKSSETISDPENTLLFSAVSIWEVSIKSGLKRTEFNVDPRVLRSGLIDSGYIELPFTSEHALAVKSLPAVHGDPFDRGLVAQALSEGIVLLTSDRVLAMYPQVRRV